MTFSLIDTDSWERSDHFNYYRNTLPCCYSLTSRLDVTKFRKMLDIQNLKFYPSFVYCVSRLIKSTDEFRMGVDADGNPGRYECMHPNYTIFHKDDGTFSDVWTPYDDDFGIFYRNMRSDMEHYRDAKGVKVKEGQPRNFFCISCLPWLSYTGISTSVPGGTPNLFPIITFGKYTDEDGRLTMPFSVTISHASADGYHTSRFMNELQEMLDDIKLYESQTVQEVHIS